MNAALWVVQGLLVALFLYSGVMKATQPEARLVALGQTGVAGLPPYLIRFIGISEILGAGALLVPWASNVLPVLTPVAATCLGLIMVPAAFAHAARREYATIWRVNAVVLGLCAFVAYGRFADLGF